MTAPRQVLPGTTHFLTRRCSERRLFLRPSALSNDIFLYVLGRAARRHGIQVHLACVMSNHYHMLVTDPRAELPAFMQYLDSLVARATNVHINHSEGFWSSEASYSTVTHGSTDDVVAKAAYILANPVAAGLVQHGREWPGVRTAPDQLGTTLTIPRPEVFFSDKGGLPESVELTLTAPPGFASVEEFRGRVAEATRALEAEHRRTAQAQQRTFLGRARVLAQNPFARPGSARPPRKINPRVAARDPRIRVEMLARLVGFERAYRERFDAYREGRRDLVFPAGTYLLRLLHGVACAPIA